ncbi:DNA topoisomerase IV, alpha subunit [Conidiobolus coronatus NRRL 28638]|uniref:DNA topoisomerase (ATP-hydrolyzing) n=1 Tax=Conidiobolus coronatus (strain ATCC 28846 / CBS 209.66 / NRRL 28638) TaxID=796925 RepID=A0A137P3U1_CONC2|nr:DNA topoisomerase IV, alpha subunit [Conidiobolus coronatus NRRL 28638]|eukprot:KXN69688.1 DNA topoisomerase IV, alpha subunit [Conidiobolus coronatus NRRL 28638]
MNEIFDSRLESEEFSDISTDSSIFKDTSSDIGIDSSKDNGTDSYNDHASLLSSSYNFMENDYSTGAANSNNTDNGYLNQDSNKKAKTDNYTINNIIEDNKPMKDIEFLIIHLINQLNLGKLPSIKFNRINLNFNSISSSRKFAIILRLLSMSYELILLNFRDLYYQDVNFFSNQLTVDRGIDQICKLLNYQSYELNIVASPKGLVAGHISIITRDKSIIKPTYINQIMLIPDISVIRKLETGANRVIIVEKEDLATRSFLNKISNLNSLKLEFLVDWDPYGIEIYLCYKYGARNRKLLNTDLKCTYGVYKGLKYTQLAKKPANFNQLISLSERDKLKIQSLLSRAEVNDIEEFSLK